MGTAANNREGLLLAARAFGSNSCVDHTLRAAIDKAETMSGVAMERAYVDKTYHGQDDRGWAQVMLSGRKQGLTPRMKGELRRRSAIEPMIGHAKNDGRLRRNHLLGHDGNAIDALLAGAGHNLRLALMTLRLLFARILAQHLAPIVF